MQEFSSSCGKILIHQKTHPKRSFKLRKMSKNENSSRAKSNQIEEDEKKKK